MRSEGFEFKVWDLGFLGFGAFEVRIKGLVDVSFGQKQVNVGVLGGILMSAK